MLFPKGQYKHEMISLCPDEEQQQSCSAMFASALGSLGSVQAGT